MVVVSGTLHAVANAGVWGKGNDESGSLCRPLCERGSLGILTAMRTRQSGGPNEKKCICGHVR